MTEKIYIDREKANRLAHSRNDDDYEIIHNEQVDSGRWEATYKLVIRRKSDGKLFGTWYELGLTELQAQRPFEEWDANADGKVEFSEFKEIEVVRKEYVPVDES